MFNNPLESFHDTVADAKAEREQLDGLLTVSSPRELPLLLLTLVLLTILVVWLIFGRVDRSVVVNATTLIEHPTQPENVDQVLHLDAWLSTYSVSEVKSGVPVTIKSLRDQQVSQTFTGVIRSTQSLNKPSADFEGLTPSILNRFEITINPAINASFDVGDEFVVIFQLGKQSPLDLIGKTLF